MTSEKNFQKVEHELYVTSISLSEFLRSPETKRWNPLTRSFVQQLVDLARAAAECAHEHRDFSVVCQIYVQSELPVDEGGFDENGFPLIWE